MYGSYSDIFISINYWDICAGLLRMREMTFLSWKCFSCLFSLVEQWKDDNILRAWFPNHIFLKWIYSNILNVNLLGKFYILVRASCVRYALQLGIPLFSHVFFLSFFLLFSFSSPFSAASYRKLTETKVVGITLSYQKKLRKTIGATLGTLYTPHLTLIWGWNH